MRVDKRKLKMASIEELKADLKEIQKEFDADNLMNPMSYAKTKELESYKEILQAELKQRLKKQN